MVIFPTRKLAELEMWELCRAAYDGQKCTVWHIQPSMVNQSVMAADPSRDKLAAARAFSTFRLNLVVLTRVLLAHSPHSG